MDKLTRDQENSAYLEELKRETMNFINELRFKCEILWIDHSRKICFGLGLMLGLWLLW